MTDYYLGLQVCIISLELLIRTRGCCRKLNKARRIIAEEVGSQLLSLVSK